MIEKFCMISPEIRLPESGFGLSSQDRTEKKAEKEESCYSFAYKMLKEEFDGPELQVEIK